MDSVPDHQVHHHRSSSANDSKSKKLLYTPGQLTIPPSTVVSKTTCPVHDSYRYRKWANHTWSGPNESSSSDSTTIGSKSVASPPHRGTCSSYIVCTASVQSHPVLVASRQPRPRAQHPRSKMTRCSHLGIHRLRRFHRNGILLAPSSARG